MIRSLETASYEDLEKVSGRCFDIFEMLDMFRFRICVGDYGKRVLKSDMRSELMMFECALDSVYDDMMKFSSNGAFEDAYNEFGEYGATFMYLPVTKSKKIDYVTMKPGSFVFSGLFCKDKSKKDYDKFMDIIGGICLPEPMIMNGCVLPDGFSDYSPDKRRDCIMSMFDETYSGLPKTSIEGVILDFEGKLFKAGVHEDNIERDIFGKKIYRDAILNDFAKMVASDSDFIRKCANTSSGYLDFVSRIFVEYMDRTDIFTKYTIGDDDVCAPNDGYIGDPDFSRIPGTASVVCMYDKRAFNIFKMLAYTLCPRSSNVKLSSLQTTNAKNIISAKEACKLWEL